MKAHRLARKQHVLQRHRLKRAIRIAQMRAVADKQMQEHWAFWQQHHIQQVDIERTLVNRMGRVERESERGQFLLWEDYHAIAREIYEKYALSSS